MTGLPWIRKLRRIVNSGHMAYTLGRIVRRIMPKRRIRMDEAPGLNAKERERLGALWGRINFLDHRIALSDRVSGYDVEEAAALRWVIEKAGMPFPPRKEVDGSDVRERIKESKER